MNYVSFSNFNLIVWPKRFWKWPDLKYHVGHRSRSDKFLDWTLYRRIFVYTFCLINICLSLSDDANKIKTEYWKCITVKVFSENLSPIHRIVSEKFSSKNSGDVRLINFFATQQFRSFWCLIFPSILLAKSWKLHKLAIAQLNQPFQLLHLAHIYGHFFY